MATTTNYSWTTPDDTALVKDGAAAIRSLGTAIDTTVFTNAGAAIAKTIVDAKGDIIAATAADTVARLAVGSNDQVLIADSTAATGLKWGTPVGGGMTLLSTTTLSGTSTTISSISGSYNNLMMIGINLSTSNQAGVWVKPNGATNCDYVGSLQVTSTRSNFGFNAAQLYFGLSEDLTANNANNNVVVTFFNYASTTANQKPLSMSCRLITGGAKTTVSAGGGVDTASAISSLEVGTNSGNLTGTVLLYGVK
jgi:hypothetical protein